MLFFGPEFHVSVLAGTRRKFDEVSCFDFALNSVNALNWVKLDTCYMPNRHKKKLFFKVKVPFPITASICL